MCVKHSTFFPPPIQTDTQNKDAQKIMKLEADAARSLLYRQGLIHEVSDDTHVPLKSLMSFLI